MTTTATTVYHVFHHNGRRCRIVAHHETPEQAIEDCRAKNQEIIDENGGHNDTGHYFTTDANDHPAE